VTIEDLIALVPSFPAVAVTGPERSGTTIATEMICHSTGYANVIEETWDNDFDRLWRILGERQRVAVHAPHLTYRLHEVDEKCGDRVLVVFMQRSVDDIVASQRRANWGVRSGHCPDGGDPKGWGSPASRWYDGMSHELFRDVIDPDAHLCLNRQQVWERRQKALVSHYVDVEYESLRSHSLWLEPDRRR